MNPTYASIARKYAAAFVNVAGAKFTHADFERVQGIAEFLVEHRALIFYFNLPLIKKQTIDQVLKKLFGGSSTEKLLYRLVALLLEHHRAFLLPEVLHQISDLYKSEKGIAQFAVRSSHQLADDQLETAIAFLKQATNKQIMYSYQVDPQLIAGLRLQSDTLLWEHSVKKQLLGAQQALRG